MTFNAGNAHGLLARFDFQRLFTEELGWDRHTATLAITIGPQTFSLRAVAEKRGMVAWLHAAPNGQRIPDRAMRKKIEKQVARSTLEHLIIFTDTGGEEQIWCWARREAGKPVSVLEHFWHGGSGNTGFLQKLARICFSIDEEERLTQLAVMGRARDAFGEGHRQQVLHHGEVRDVIEQAVIGGALGNRDVEQHDVKLRRCLLGAEQAEGLCGGAGGVVFDLDAGCLLERLDHGCDVVVLENAGIGRQRQGFAGGMGAADEGGGESGADEGAAGQRGDAHDGAPDVPGQPGR